jgi:hypothetical protein
VQGRDAEATPAAHGKKILHVDVKYGVYILSYILIKVFFKIYLFYYKKVNPILKYTRRYKQNGLHSEIQIIFFTEHDRPCAAVSSAAAPGSKTHGAHLDHTCSISMVWSRKFVCPLRIEVKAYIKKEICL